MVMTWRERCESLKNSRRRTVAVQKTSRFFRKMTAFLFRAFFLTGFCFVILYPVIFMVARMFMSVGDIYDNSIFLIPNHFTLQNIRIAASQLDYLAKLRNTIFLTLGVTLLTLCSCLMAGYALARFNFKLKGLFFSLVVLTIMTPPQLISTQLFFNFRFFDLFGLFHAIAGNSVNLIDTYWPFLMLAATGMGIKNGIFIYLFRQFFKNIPIEMEEAAEIDGAGSFKIFVQVMLPNAVTIIATVFLLCFVWQYNDGTYTNIFISSSKLFANCYSQLSGLTAASLQVLGLSNADAITISMYQPLLKSAGVFLMMLPLLIVFLITQRYFVESVERSGIVG